MPLPCQRFPLALPILLIATSAGATATLTCDIDDRNAEISLQGNMGRDVAAVQITAGAIKLKPVRGAGDGIEFPVEGEHLIQQWAHGNELRLGIQTAEVKGMSVYLAIIAQKTKSGDGDSYRGRYMLKVQGNQTTRELKGRIRGCEAG